MNIAYTVNSRGGRTTRYSSVEAFASAYGLRVNDEGTLFNRFGAYVGHAEEI